MTTLIMAAGKGERWLKYRDESQSIHKPLIKIYDVGLNDRISAQLSKRNLNHVTVISDLKLSVHLLSRSFLITPTPSLANSILAVEHLWSYPLTILLGDVIYDNKDLDLIYSPTSSGPTFFGRHYETYAVRFTTSPKSLLTNVTRYIGYDRVSNRTNEGKLRDIRYFVRFGGLPNNREFNERKDRSLDPNFHYVTGYTQDIDHMADLNRITRILKCAKATLTPKL